MEQALAQLFGSPLEGAAVALSIAYVILAAAKSIWCWPCALVSTAIYSVLFWDVSLPMEAALNLYYFAMAIFGWWQWRKTSSHADTGELILSRWKLKTHLAIVALIATLTLLSGTLLEAYRASAALPFLDSFTTWGAVVATVMVAKRVIENWIYWIVINLAAIVLYLDRELYLTVGLFVVYVIVAAIGWLRWKDDFAKQQAH